MKKCVVDIRYRAAVGNYSRILVVLTSHQGERKMEETKRSEMSKDQFWNLIEKAKEVCGPIWMLRRCGSSNSFSI